ncbi:MAG: transposase [Thiohalocapsa sp. PB-PSB1]|jgi:putative transposase|nr:MAG: transposase [Thiohalocapsa sp. PB-PSB1]
MPRRARIIAAGYPMHLILRGIDRAAVFFEDADRQFFLDHLAAVAAEESVAVHAYVLMTNHLHLLMTAARDDGVSAVMKRVGQRSVQHVNRTSRRTGGLFEGRFRSSLIEADTCLLACQRYIELNPVRASMVSVPGDYRWSSHRANALGRQDSMVTPHPLYQGLADADQARFAAYRRLFEDMLGAESHQCFRECTNGGFVIGSAKFKRQIAAMLGRRTWKEAPGRPLKEIDADAQGELAL